eukprot:CAMPEP_0115156548 /NCGR_PEP_ID=MMETSP0227-20121206/68509_1 /TAXON_ID=89957 /ORGANISM="Polarella glacialis, Strain CCMP 1383" /LENGTH=370 /DNA_ID=CAMNT_0002567743 /DNA_START=22 /DNA_END=1134 /DNA_ORIENTATION=+
MAQTAQPASTGRATPFPSPPGLEHPAPGAESMAEEVPSAIHEALRRSVMRDLDTKVTERVEELWQKGKQMLTQVQQKQQDKVEKLSSEMSRCLERQQALEKENEQLKQALALLVARFQIGGAGSMSGPSGSQTPISSGGGPGCSPSPPQTGTTLGPSSNSPNTRGSASDLFTPVQMGGGDISYPPLPEVPAFPFPSQAAPLSLAEALGAGPSLVMSAGPPTPLSLASSLPLEAGNYGRKRSCVFSFTLRKADQTELGLNVVPSDNDKVLFVEGIRPEGAVDAWNRQCVGGAFPEKAVMQGDRIVCVNEKSYDPTKMLEECKEKQLLKLTIVRGDAPLPELPGVPQSPGKLTSLRAEAHEFVPMGPTSKAE